MSRQSSEETAKRGLTGSLTIRHSGERLTARLDQETSAPVLVRVTEISAGQVAMAQAHSPNPREYRIDYMGVVAGEFDLTRMIVHADGTPATEIGPLMVTIVSDLPPQHGTDLFGGDRLPQLDSSHYRLLAVALGAAWVAVPIVFFIRRRMMRSKPIPTVPAAPPPTLADQLRPLVEAAMSGQMDTAQRARLELLLFSYWSERRSLQGISPAEALATLRVDPEASPLLLAIESWLHAPAGEARPHADLLELLRPYAAQGAFEMEGFAASNCAPLTR